MRSRRREGREAPEVARPWSRRRADRSAFEPEALRRWRGSGVRRTQGLRCPCRCLAFPACARVGRARAHEDAGHEADGSKLGIGHGKLDSHLGRRPPLASRAEISRPLLTLLPGAISPSRAWDVGASLARFRSRLGGRFPEIGFPLLHERSNGQPGVASHWNSPKPAQMPASPVAKSSSLSGRRASTARCSGTSQNFGGGSFSISSA
jgi:hypothetical protein